MGQDLHPFIEYDEDTEGKFQGSVFCFTRGEFCVRLDVAAFNAIAGHFRFEKARFPEDYEYYKKDPSLQPLYPPRGIPKNLSHTVAERYYIYICKEKEKSHFEVSYDYLLRTTSAEEAEEWVEQGKSHYGGDSNIIHHHWNKPYQWVSNPIWHCPGWLKLIEFREVIQKAQQDPKYRAHNEFEILILIMEELERTLGPGTTRLVFWFDN